ncbi:MAG TPA: DNA topoisomerase IB [Candidatus Dormibacteraeota bacterium]|nr:DNA topoisomerase IB [Candidatus Dormibacteraeota bacterium]
MAVILAAVDPVEAARRAGLRYVSDSMPGIRRQSSGDTWAYIDPEGNRIRDAVVVQRIHHLAIPPAWTDVWICPLDNGHIQATGRDARRRKQYRYHDQWRAVRDEAKYSRMIAFGKALPRIRERVAHDIELPDLPRDKVLAAVVRLLDTTAIRVGNEEYAKENDSYGLTTMRSRFAKVDGKKVEFEFRGKAGKYHAVAVEDARLARIIRECQELPGQELFQYVDDSGTRHHIHSEDVNEHLQEVAGEDFTAKDFRTWTGTVVAACYLRELGPASTQRELKRHVKEAIEQVAEALGNTPAIARRCYVHPDVIEAYSDGSLLRLRLRHTRPTTATQAEGLREEERTVLRLLERRSLPRAVVAAGS